jgi:RNA polymerase sigma factor (sigma-70 family)
MAMPSPTFEQWQPLVLHVASQRFRHIFGADRDDLLQEGYMALMRAIDTYDPSHASGASFKSYAFRCIWGGMIDARKKERKYVLTQRLVNEEGRLVDVSSVGDKEMAEQRMDIKTLLKLLKGILTRREFTAVRHHANGLPFTAIGRRMRCSGQWSHFLWKRAVKKAREVVK